MMSLDECLEHAGNSYRGAVEAMPEPKFRRSEVAASSAGVTGRRGIGRRWVRPAGWVAVAAVVVGLLVMIGVWRDSSSTPPADVSTPPHTTVQVLPSTTPAPTTTPTSTLVTTTLEPTSLPTVSVPPSDGGDVLDIDIAPVAFDLDLAPCEPDLCPSIATRDGMAISYDRVANTISIDRQGDTPPRTIDIKEALDAATGYLTAIGPDDVAYLVVQSQNTTDPIGDVVAVALTGDQAGSIVARQDDTVDLSGDSSLVPTRTGLVSVGCCGPETVRPDPNSAPVMTWVDHNGNETADTAQPQVSIEVTTQGFDVIRTEPDGTTARWPAPRLWATGLRGMPTTAALTDGSVVASWFDWAAGTQRLARFKPSGTIEQISVRADISIAALETFGGAIIYNGNRYQHWQLPTYTAPIDNLAKITALAGTEPLTSADDAIERIAAALTRPEGCENPATARAINRAGTDPVAVTIEHRFSCDDSGAGTNIDLTLQSEPTGTWTITKATQRSLCRRGGDEQACT